MFDLSSWSSRLAATALLCDDDVVFLKEIVGPIDAVRCMHLRDLLYSRCVLGTSTPTDMFLLGLGESKDRCATKIGGLPYWPAELEWPTYPDGTFMPFFAQIDLRASRDILMDLPIPNDIMLIFGRPNRRFPQEIHVEWQKVVEDQPLVSTVAFHTQNSLGQLPVFYGERWRTTTFTSWQPEDEDEFSAMSISGQQRIAHPYNAFMLPGLQVCRRPSTTSHCDSLENIFCCIPSFMPTMFAPFPFMNRETSIDDDDEAISLSCWFSPPDAAYEDQSFLIFMCDKHGQISWEFTVE